MSMCVHAGALYAGTGVWDWVGAEVGPDRPADGFIPARSHVFVYRGGSDWQDLGPVGHGVRVHTMCSFQGHLYVGLDRADGRCFRREGPDWVDCGTPDGNSIENLFGFAGALYGATHGRVYVYEGDQSWRRLGDEPLGTTQNHAMHVLDGRLITGTWPQGHVLRYDGKGTWTTLGRLGLQPGLAEINEINSLIVHQGKLYAGVLPKAQVWRYESDGNWSLLGSLARRMDYDETWGPTWGRVTCLTTFGGRLFASTGACQARVRDIDPAGRVGRVWSIGVGQMVSHEHDIGGSWTHLAASRRGRELRLHVNGSLTAACELENGVCLDLRNTEPLRIGSGARCAFDGWIADVRLYGAALGDREIEAVAHASKPAPRDIATAQPPDTGESR